MVRLKKGEEWTHRGEGLAFVFPQSGVGIFQAGPISQSVAPGDVLVVNGSPNGNLAVTNGPELLFWWFRAELEHLYPLFSSQEIGALHNVHQAYRSLRLYGSVTPIAKQCKRLLDDVPPQLNLEHRGHVLKLAAAVLSKEFSEANTQRDGFLNVEEHVKQVLEHLSLEEVLDLSVSELAEKFKCSRRHLNRLFHQYFGLSVAALRMEMRLLKAVSLLRDPEAKIINVADDCGFNHLGLFNMCFKKRFGTSPGDWRRKNVTAKGCVTPPTAPPEETGCRLGVNGLCPWNVNTGSEATGPERARPSDSPDKRGGSSPNGEDTNITKGRLSLRLKL